MRVASVLVAADGLAACAGSGASPASSVVLEPGVASAVPGDLEAQSPGPVTPAGEVNRKAAAAEADRLMGLAQVPPTAVEIPTAQATLTAAMIGLRVHPPSGLHPNATGRGGGPGFTAEGVAYAAPVSPAWDSAQLAVSVATVTASTSEIRVDAQVLWLDPTPLPDNRPGPRLYVTVADGCPKSDQGIVGVTNAGPDVATRMLPDGAPTSGLVCTFGGMNPPGVFTLLTSTRVDAAAAGRLAAQARAIRLSHTNSGIHGCPADLGGATLVAFTFSGRRDVDLWSTDGCVSVANGVISAAGRLAAP